MDMDSILKRAQEFQYLMSKKQEELAGRTVTSTVGGGMVTGGVVGAVGQGRGLPWRCQNPSGGATSPPRLRRDVRRMVGPFSAAALRHET